MSSGRINLHVWEPASQELLESVYDSTCHWELWSNPDAPHLMRSDILSSFLPLICWETPSCQSRTVSDCYRQTFSTQVFSLIDRPAPNHISTGRSEISTQHLSPERALQTFKTILELFIISNVTNGVMLQSFYSKTNNKLYTINSKC